ncbi:MAG: hypothetical protein R2706_14900, partial [Acidimicrobiales bacterium]
EANDLGMTRMAVSVNAASAARVGDFERAIRWAELHGDLSDGVRILGESEVVVSLALARLQRGNVREAAQLLRSSEYEGVANRYAASVQALVCAMMRQSDEVERLAAMVAGTGTYLDQIFALWALTLDRSRRGDDGGAAEALAQAHEVVSKTDDRLTLGYQRILLALVTGSDPEPAANAVRAYGVNPAGWHLLFERVLARVAPAEAG